MNNKRFWLSLVISLVIINFIMIALLILGRPKRPSTPDRPANYVIKELQLDQDQISAYQLLIERHKEESGEKSKEINELRKALFNSVTGTEVHNADSIIQLIGQVQQDIERIHYNHFLDIKNLCTPEQQLTLDKVIHRLGRQLAPGNRPGARIPPGSKP